MLGMWGTQREQVTCCHSRTEGSGGGRPARGLSRPGTACESHLAWGAGGGQATRRSHSEKLNGHEWPHVPQQAQGSSPSAPGRSLKSSWACGVLGNSIIPYARSKDLSVINTAWRIRDL